MWRDHSERFYSELSFHLQEGEHQIKDRNIALHEDYETDPTSRVAELGVYQTVRHAIDDEQHSAALFNLAVPGSIYSDHESGTSILGSAFDPN